MNLLCINFSSILSTLDRREVDLQLENSSLESFLWIRISFATFSFSGNIPVASDTLKITERCQDISSLGSLRISEVMLFGLTDLLGLKFGIISIISSSVQVEMKNESQGVEKYSKLFDMKMTLPTALLTLPNRRNY